MALGLWSRAIHIAYIVRIITCVHCVRTGKKTISHTELACLVEGWLPEHETIHLPVTTLSVGWPSSIKYGPETILFYM